LSLSFFLCLLIFSLLFFFSNAPATTAIYTLSLHDALPISPTANVSGSVQTFTSPEGVRHEARGGQTRLVEIPAREAIAAAANLADRKSTRLNSSHVAISYAVFCLKKKKKQTKKTQTYTSKQ